MAKPMFTECELRDAIAECQGLPPTYTNCEKLAVFTYLYKAYFADGKPVEPEAVNVQSEVQATSGSEFMQAVSGRDWTSLLVILDELMDTVKILQPRLYDAVMQKLKE